MLTICLNTKKLENGSSVFYASDVVKVLKEVKKNVFKYENTK